MTEPNSSARLIRLANEPPTCPYCGSEAKLVDSKVIYHGRSYGMAWVCGNYPTCDSYVGCHPKSDMPLGRLADAELREAKKAAHAAFDPMWKSGKMRRGEAYRWLARRLGLREVHIGEMDVRTCKLVVKVCQ